MFYVQIPKITQITFDLECFKIYSKTKYTYAMLTKTKVKTCTYINPICKNAYYL